MSINNTFKDLTFADQFGDLGDFAPKPVQPEQPKATPQQIERIAAQEGFALDNHPVARRALKSGRVAARDKAQPMTLRIRVADWNRFSAFCERNGYTVAEGFEQLAQVAETL